MLLPMIKHWTPISCFVTTVLIGIVFIRQGEGQIERENVSEADYYRMVPFAFQLSEQEGGNADVAAAPNGYRPGHSTTTNTCQQISSVPAQLRSGRVMKPTGLASFYQKYTETYGIPVLCNRAVRNAFYRLSGRVAVIGQSEGTNWIPEHSNLPNWWNQRARGLGATPYQPVSSGGEENVLCYQNDRYRAQDIFLHETAHGVHLLGAAHGVPGWDSRLRSLYNQAKSRGLWANTYSMSTPEEYFAEGTQSYFNVNSYAPRPDGVRGPINTRTKLRTYDPQLYQMIKQIFPCDNVYYKRCNSSRAMEHSQRLQMDCDVDGVRPTTSTTTTTITTTATRRTTTSTSTGCRDKHQHCAYWASVGECDNNPSYMMVNCKQSCGLCGVECADKHAHCSYWTNNGECEANPSFMNVNCAASCERC